MAETVPPTHWLVQRGIRLPHISKTQIPIPTCLARSGFFAAFRGNQVRPVAESEHPITIGVRGKNLKITQFQGQRLNQEDFDVWLAILAVAQTSNCPNPSPSQPIPITFSLRTLAKLAHRSTAGSGLEGLKNTLVRLSQSQFELEFLSESGPPRTWKGSLLAGELIAPADTESHNDHYCIHIAPGVHTLFAEGMTFIDIEMRHQLGADSLAKWLHALYGNQSTPLPTLLTTLHDLSGKSNQQFKAFQAALSISIEKVKSKTGWTMRIDEMVKLHVKPFNSTLSPGEKGEYLRALIEDEKKKARALAREKRSDRELKKANLEYHASKVQSPPCSVHAINVEDEK